jgi:hypothetical protein
LDKGGVGGGKKILTFQGPLARTKLQLPIPLTFKEPKKKPARKAGFFRS